VKGWQRTALVAAGLVAAHEGAVRAADRVGLVERMLSPGGSGVAVAAVAAVGLFALRRGVVFVLPGWLLARAIGAWRARRGGDGAR
jgi:hypothetical protein